MDAEEAAPLKLKLLLFYRRELDLKPRRELDGRYGWTKLPRS
jgi:hypothetical protein